MNSHMIQNVAYLLVGFFILWLIVGLTLQSVGLVRTKNAVDVMGKSLSAFAVGSIIFMWLGFHVMYSGKPLIESILPTLKFALGGRHHLFITQHGGLGFLFWQILLSVLVMTIFIGATAERFRLWPLLIFTGFMTGIIYPVEGFWTWGGGWLSQLGFMDVSGAGVVHLAGASAALAGILVVKARSGKYGSQRKSYAGSNLPLAGLGSFFVWLGSFGFNSGGVVMHINEHIAASLAAVFVNTNAAVAGGLLMAMVVSRFITGKTDFTLMLNGAIAGVVAMSALPTGSNIAQALLVGAIAGLLVVLTIKLLDIWRLDDPVGAVAVHGMGSIVGLLCVVFIEPEKWQTFPRVWSIQLLHQLLGILVIFAWTFLASLVVLFSLYAILGIRLQEHEETAGLDHVDYGMSAYPEFIVAKR